MSPDTRTTRSSRRAFLRLATLFGGSALLAACQQAPAPAAEARPRPSRPRQPPSRPPPPQRRPSQPRPRSPLKLPSLPPTPSPLRLRQQQPLQGGKRGGVLNYAEAADFTHFSPWSVTPPNQGIYNQVFNRLLWKDGTGKEHADIAESWEMAKDSLSFRVKMKQGVKWHDGKEHVAEDYVTMFGYTKDETLLKDAAVKKHQGLVCPVKEVKAVDKYTVDFIFGTPGAVHHRAARLLVRRPHRRSGRPRLHQEAADRHRAVQDGRVAAEPVRALPEEP